MTDPISLAGIAITVGQVLSSLSDYGRNVKSARKEINSLGEELFALKGVLEHLKAQYTPEYNQEEFKGMLQSASEILQSLLNTLEEPKSRFKKSMQRLTWPLDRGDVDKQVAQLGRLKTCFILISMTDSSAITRDIHSEVSELSRSLRADLELREQERIDNANEDLLRWMAPAGPEENHRRACKARQEGTGRWFIDGPLFYLLKPSPSGGSKMLCLTGKSGIGKTTLFSHIVEELATRYHGRSDVGLAYFYCTFENPTFQQPVNILGSIAAQLSHSMPSILESMRSHFNNSRSTKYPKTLELSELEAVLVEHLAGFATVFVLIDAINESEHISSLLDSILRLTERSQNLRVLLTSTKDAISFRENDLCRIVTVPMQHGDVQIDIASFIEERLGTDQNLRHLSGTLKDEIRRSLLSTANGSFRWVQLSLDHLNKGRTGKMVRHALNKMPESLQETYASMLERIPNHDRTIAREALLWLSFAKKPLNLVELAEAVVFEDTDASLDDDDRLRTPHTLLEICQGFVEFNMGKVTLAHSSIKTFLCSEWIRSSAVKFFSLDPAAGNKTIMRKCLAYLLFDDFRDGYVESDSPYTITERFGKYHLLGYATFLWPIHGNLFDFDDSDRQLVRRFFETKRLLPRGGNFSAWVQNLIPDANVEDIRRTQPLYYASSYGLTQAVKLILDADPDLDVDAAGGRFYCTPLFVACYREHRAVVELLLAAGANPKADPGGKMNGDSNYTPLSFLEEFGPKDILELLRANLLTQVKI